MEDIFLFVLGYLIQLAACCLLCMKITQQRSIYGLSTSTQICFCVANVGRCVWTLETRLVAFTMYLEALGMIPQLWLMRKTTYVEPLTSHYVLLIVVSRLCRMIFWGVLFFRGEHFLQLFLFDLMHTVCAADYVYLWVKKLRTGGKLVYAI